MEVTFYNRVCVQEYFGLSLLGELFVLFECPLLEVSLYMYVVITHSLYGREEKLSDPHDVAEYCLHGPQSTLQSL